MTGLLVAVIIASLLGSLHCAGMCGPFVAFATLRPRRDSPMPQGSALLQLAYHAGRLVSYTLLGMIAGQLGATLDLGSTVLGFGRVAGVLAGLSLIAAGLLRMASLLGRKVAAGPSLKWLATLIAAGQVAASRLTPIRRALAVGLLTTAIPCGWLYAFVAVAAGTGHPLSGVIVMLAFWSGTVPVLVGIGTGLGAIVHRANPMIQTATALVVIVLGVQSIAGRWGFDPSRIAAPTSTVHAAQARIAGLLGAGQHRCH